MKITNMSMLDLGRLCGESLETPVNPAVVIIELQRSGENLVGRVRNDTGKPVRYVIVNYEVASLTAEKSKVANLSFVSPETLQPGEIGSFQGSLKELGEVRITSVEWDI